MNENSFLNQIKQIGVGLAFIIFPMLFIFAFAVHPGLLQPHLLDPEGMILRAHRNGLLQFGHVLVTFCTLFCANSRNNDFRLTIPLPIEVNRLAKVL